MFFITVNKQVFKICYVWTKCIIVFKYTLKKFLYPKYLKKSELLLREIVFAQVLTT